jgi:GH15 family glucan-1,4-alpha-glucosidase
VESYGSETLDASILLMSSVGFLPASDPRVKGTVAAVEKYMMRDGFVLRHDPREVTGEVQPIEGAFLACSLWLAEVYIQMGELDKAEALFDRVVGVANDVGLLAEEYDPLVKRQTGNFPQALTHISLIAVAQNLAGARAPQDKPKMGRTK